MQVYQDLIISGSDENLKKWLSEIDGRLVNGWIHNIQNEDNISSSTNHSMYCFSCDKRETRPPASLWVSHYEENKMTIPNIVPEGEKLSMAMYNTILKEFHSFYIEPMLEMFHLDVQLSPENITISDLLPEITLRLFILFSRTSNKSTGNIHPSDRTKWFDFVISCHKENVELDTSLLKRWLVEEEGWSSDIALELIIDYETQIVLLSHYDSNY
jgi:hypothetical protein